MKKYVKPNIEVIQAQPTTIMVSSFHARHFCDKKCMMWRNCIGRKKGSVCNWKRIK
jgi:hypothetical protein